MKFIDLNDDRGYTLQDLRRDWAQFREEYPENHAPEEKNVPGAVRRRGRPNRGQSSSFFISVRQERQTHLPR